MPNIGDHPTADDAIKRQQHKTGHHTEPTDQRPDAAGADAVKRLNRIVAAVTADDELGDQHRRTDQKRKHDKEQEKHRAAVRAGGVGKFPDGAETDGRTGGGENETETGRPIIVLTHKQTGLRKRATLCHLPPVREKMAHKKTAPKGGV